MKSPEWGNSLSRHTCILDSFENSSLVRVRAINVQPMFANAHSFVFRDETGSLIKSEDSPCLVNPPYE